LDFEWDAAKAALNLKKHGVDFEFAKLIFAAPFSRGRMIGRTTTRTASSRSVPSMRPKLSWFSHGEERRVD